MNVTTIIDRLSDLTTQSASVLEIQGACKEWGQCYDGVTVFRTSIALRSNQETSHCVDVHVGMAQVLFSIVLFCYHIKFKWLKYTICQLNKKYIHVYKATHNLNGAVEDSWHASMKMYLVQPQECQKFAPTSKHILVLTSATIIHVAPTLYMYRFLACENWDEQPQNLLHTLCL